MPNGGDSGGFFFDPGVFFGGVLDTLIAVVNAIIAGLVYLFNLLVSVFNFLYNALVAIANAVVSAVKVIARGFVHVISDIIHGRFLHLFQDFIDLKNKLAAWLAPVLRILQRIRALYQQFILKPLLAYINLIQHIRQFLVLFRLLGFKWAAVLDNKLVKIEQQAIQNVLVLQAYVNLAISILDLVIDPSLIFRKNVLLASLVAALGVIKRVVFFGANRSPSADETKQMKQDTSALSPQTKLLASGFGKSATYYPTINRVVPCLDDAVKYYQGGATGG